MRPCFFYIQKDKIQQMLPSFSCIHASDFIDGEPFNYIDCPHYFKCQYRLREYNKVKLNNSLTLSNVVVNKHKNGKIEICKHRDFAVKIQNKSEHMGRNWFWDEFGYLTPKSKLATFPKLERAALVAQARSLDKALGILENNDWRYFVTLTFSKEFVNRFDDESVKYEWKLFRQAVCRFDENAKIFCSPERHESGALHFHAMIATEKDFPIVATCKETETWNLDGSANLPADTNKGRFKYLFPIYEARKWKKSSNGNQFFAFSFFQKGRNFTAILNPNDNESAVINYVSKYLTKAMTIGYGDKRYFATRNCETKEKYNAKLSDEEIEYYIEAFKLDTYKETKKISVYRNYNIMGDENNEK